VLDTGVLGPAAWTLSIPELGASRLCAALFPVAAVCSTTRPSTSSLPSATREWLSLAWISFPAWSDVDLQLLHRRLGPDPA
jgi:hypothetical protein